MSEAAVDESTNELILDGELPRLGATPMLPDAPAITPATDAPELSLVSPVLTGEPAPMIPTLPTSTGMPAPSLPSLEKQSLVDLAAVVAAEETDKVVERRHPMAHLMPEKMKPTEASLRAAEQRAAKKKKAKKIKIAVTVAVLAVVAIVGPPLGRWLVDAINEAGSTESDDPAPAVESNDPAGDPAATPQAGLDAIGDLEQLVGGTTVPTNP
jgi:hypothetical protein